MAGLSAVAEEPLGGVMAQIAVGLANEGVPLRAIVRAMALPRGSVVSALHDALELGKIGGLPAEDWPIGTTTGDRVQATRSIQSNDAELTINAMRILGTTKLQSRLLIVLIKRQRCTKEVLHNVVEDGRPTANDPTDPKIVDVVICHLRKKLAKQSVEIKTIWSVGYEIVHEHRKKLLDLLCNGELPEGSEPLPVEAAA